MEEPKIHISPAITYDVSKRSLAAIAANICRLPVAIVAISTNNKTNIVSKYGLQKNTEQVALQCCEKIIQKKEVFQVPDAEAFDYLIQDINITPFHFYAGVPVIKDNGNIIGAIVVLDTQRNYLNKEVFGLLQAFAKQSAALFDLEDAVSERKNLEADAQKITGILAHDVLNPMASLKNIVELQKSGLIDAEELQSMLPVFVHDSDRISHLVTNLAIFTRVMSNINADKTDFELKYLETNELQALKKKCFEKNNVFVSNIPESLPVKIHEPALNFILGNLIHNANKFTENGTISVNYRNFDNTHWIEVSDTGVGIKQDDLKKINSVKSTYCLRGTKNEKGSGLGLYFVREMQHALHKEFVLDSEQGKGTTALFEL